MISVASTLDKAANEVIIKLVNPIEEEVDTVISLNGIKQVDPDAKLSIIAGPKPARNTRENPDTVKTQTKPIKVSKEFEYTVPAMSVQFIRVKIK
jgi:alpha-L-arabinofuranosidase